jgi:hypothetical protein
MKKSLVVVGTLFVSLVLLTSPADAKGRGGGHGSRGGHSSSGHSSLGHVGTGSKVSHERVSGYTKKNGTHVTTYKRSTRDGTKNNNWSTKGNRNPDTGKMGTKPGD